MDDHNLILSLGISWVNPLIRCFCKNILAVLGLWFSKEIYANINFEIGLSSFTKNQLIDQSTLLPTLCQASSPVGGWTGFALSLLINLGRITIFVFPFMNISCILVMCLYSWTWYTSYMRPSLMSSVSCHNVLHEGLTCLLLPRDFDLPSFDITPPSPQSAAEPLCARGRRRQGPRRTPAGLLATPPHGVVGLRSWPGMALGTSLVALFPYQLSTAADEV